MNCVSKWEHSRLISLPGVNDFQYFLLALIEQSHKKHHCRGLHEYFEGVAIVLLPFALRSADIIFKLHLAFVC